MNQKEWAIPQSFLAIACAVLMLVFSGQIFAQAGIDMGSVTGTVKDQTGAVVQKAQCTLTNVDTGTSQTAVSTSVGAYVFTQVSVGTYNLKVGAKGFEDSVVNGIIVHLGNTVTQDVSLHVGAANASVTVTSAAPLLQAQDASLGTTIDSTAATELPLYGGSGGRSFMSLITSVPGVQFGGNNSSTGTFYINGQNNGAVDVRVNGADDNAEVFGGITIPPIPDAIQEMKIETGDNPSEVGHSYGTTVNVVTKAGTNKLVGSAWEYDENDMFNANDYFNKRNQVSGGHPNRPGRLKSNSFGAIIGGPVVIPHIYDGHNKTFFTADFQYTDYTAESAYTGTLPTATMQSSGFTNLVDTLNLSTTKYTDGLGRQFQAGTVLDPATTRTVLCGATDPITGIATTSGCASGAVGIITDPNVNAGAKTAVVRDPYFQELGQPAGCPSIVGTTNWVSTVAGGPVATSCFNNLPSGRMDANALALLKLFPQTYNNVNINTTTGLSTAGIHSYGSNFYELLTNPIRTRQYEFRLDHTFSDKDSAFLTWDKYNQTQQQAPPYPAPLEGGGSAPFWMTNPTYMVVVTETHVFNPSLVNEFRMSDEHNWNTRMDAGTIDNTFGTPAKYGIQGIPQTVNNGGLPVFGVGSSISAFGSRVNVTWQKVGAWQFSDNLTKIIGKNEWKFGAEYWWTYGNIAQLPYSRGNFSYGQYSNVPASGDSGPGMTDFLLKPTAANSTYAAANGVSTSALPLGGLNGYNGDNWNKSIYHAPYISFYASDSIKFTPSLTGYFAMRDDYFGPYYSAGGSEGEGNFWMGGSDGNEASGSAYYMNAAGCSTTTSAYFRGLLASDNIPIICSPTNAVNKTPKFNWAPRIGLDYRVRPNLVVKMGGGVAYGAFDSEGYGNTLGTNYPFRVSVQNGPSYSYKPQTASNAANPTPQTATMENVFGLIDMTSATNAYQPLGSVYMFGKRYNYHIPYEETLSFAVQYQFTGHDSVEVRYVGVLGKQLENLGTYHNAARQALPTSTAAVTSCSAAQLAANPYCENSPAMPDGTTTVPFPNLAASSAMQDTEEISNYESGQVEYIHQFAGGFNMDANYTYAGCLSDAQAGEQNTGGPGNGRAPWIVGFGGYRADYDRCTNTAAQLFKLSGEYGLPFGKGALLAGNANPLEDAIIGGWKLDPMWISSSGLLANITCQGTIGGIPNAPGQFTGPWFQTGSTSWNCYAPTVSGVNKYGHGPNDLPRTKVTGWWNSAAFTAPQYAVTSIGSQDFTPFGHRGNQIYGPGWYDVDLAIHKQFKIYGVTKLEITGQAINAFNHVHLSNPGTSNYTQPQNETLTGGWGTITGDSSINSSGRIWQFAGKFFF
ncbi:MAG: carboxypeptidase-like regulatory domain-containing protein [Terracidiphilus sp.]